MFQQQVTHGNILSFTPPGFNQTLNVKFPDSRLAVCEKCKRNYKTRDMCRVRNSHTSEPWTTAFICITLDDSCFVPGTKKYTEKPLGVRLVPWQPYSVKKPFAPKTPVCAACKKTNRTRSFCRNRHQHKALPWCTVYVVLSAVENGAVISNVNPGAKVISKSKSKATSKLQKDMSNISATNIKKKVEKIAKLINDSEGNCEKMKALASKDDFESNKNESKGTSKEKKETEGNFKNENNSDEDGENDDDEEDEDDDKLRVTKPVFIKQEEVEESKEENKEDAVQTEKNGNKVEKEEGTKDDEKSDKEGDEEEKNESGKEKLKPKKPVDEDEELEVGDDINDIAKSKTFLAKVSCRDISIHWLETSDFDSNSACIPPMPQSAPEASAFDPTKMMTGQPMPAGFDPAQYYSQMAAMGYPQLSQQQLMHMQQQQFLHMQQRQHFAAQHAAWQQYNQHVMMNGHMMAQHGMAMMPQMQMQAMNPVTPEAQSDGGTNDETKEENGTSATSDPAAATTAGAAIVQAQAQWQAQMMYQQHLYHQQFQMQQMAAAQQQQMMVSQTPGMYFPGHPLATPAQTATASTKNSLTNEEKEEDKESSLGEAPAKKAKLTEI